MEETRTSRGALQGERVHPTPGRRGCPGWDAGQVRREERQEAVQEGELGRQGAEPGVPGPRGKCSPFPRASLRAHGDTPGTGRGCRRPAQEGDAPATPLLLPPQLTTVRQSHLDVLPLCPRATHLLSSSYFDLEREMGRDKRACLEQAPLLSPQAECSQHRALHPTVPPAPRGTQCWLQTLLPTSNSKRGSSRIKEQS